MTPSSSNWQRLEPPSPNLFESRLQLHWALQIAASVGHTFIPPVDDQSHTNFEWMDEHEALVGKITPNRFRNGLRFRDLTLLLFDAGGTVTDECRLVDKTLEDGYSWLEQTISSVTGKPLDKILTKHPYDLPEHPVAHGTAFNHSELFAELARWYTNANTVLNRVRTENARSSPVRCWPHHFDIATLITLDPDRDPEEARSIGVGMTPGDNAQPEPYWYVTPWPYPVAPTLSPLEGGGHWNTDGWLGAVLPASDMQPTAPAQAVQVNAFLRSAIDACRNLLKDNG
jgi:hypothetical protein